MENKPTFEHPQSQGNHPENFRNAPVEDYIMQIAQLSDKIDSLIASHQHNGNLATRINLNTDLIGLFETVSVTPTGKPLNPYEQIKIYINSTTYRLYWYDAVGNVWHYVTATA